ncbi:hypothetical protein [Legionella sp.]|uniref:hypothetical protein n=1 Tax=Legionella sp. TaxID=459 RepID=UPI003CBF3A52
MDSYGNNQFGFMNEQKNFFNTFAKEYLALGNAVIIIIDEILYFIRTVNSKEKQLRWRNKNRLKHSYNCIILDWGLPDKPGEELLHFIRSSQLNKNSFIIVASAHFNEEIK